MLAVGIAGNGAIFSIFNGLFLAVGLLANYVPARRASSRCARVNATADGEERTAGRLLRPQCH